MTSLSYIFPLPLPTSLPLSLCVCVCVYRALSFYRSPSIGLYLNARKSTVGFGRTEENVRSYRKSANRELVLGRMEEKLYGIITSSYVEYRFFSLEI